jgi:hypothetical protein
MHRSDNLPPIPDKREREKEIEKKHLSQVQIGFVLGNFYCTDHSTISSPIGFPAEESLSTMASTLTTDPSSKAYLSFRHRKRDDDGLPERGNIRSEARKS